ncbi:PhzF family phenazine biosynthesis protein [Streptomyces sp. NPDC047117]|uniref:PhzF family phenazine biosynthesis protein n=1 Tax=Streptomyces sp. NPDC047117 TaxID=3155379 RepID=UPI00340E4DF7
MLAVAGEPNNSETAFVLPPDGPDHHDVRVRFFTPTAEVPTCGHATIGTHCAQAVEYGLPTGPLVQKTGAELRQHVEIQRADRVRIGIRQDRAEFGRS